MEISPTVVVRPMRSARKDHAVLLRTFLSRKNHVWTLYDRAVGLAKWGRLLVRTSESGIHSAAELASARASMSEDQYLREYKLEGSVKRRL